MVVAKALFLPLLQLSSGHHQVADALARWLLRMDVTLHVEKVELLSTFNRFLERLITRAYVHWIGRYPHTYAWLYRRLALTGNGRIRAHYRGYDTLFRRTVRTLIEQHAPDLVICTHALPSYLCNALKQRGEIDVPIANVYTDFFINDLWGYEAIDVHFVPTVQAKQALRARGVKAEHILVTGIPVDYVFHEKEARRSNHRRPHLLLAGGSTGIGHTRTRLLRLLREERADYTVLCGENIRWYEELVSLQLPHVRPLRYVTSRKAMKHLYDSADALITKAGGVTMSEAMHAHLPVFIHAALPGQEQYNRAYVLEHQLAQPLDIAQPITAQIQAALADTATSTTHRNAREGYLQSLQWHEALQRLSALL